MQTEQESTEIIGVVVETGADVPEELVGSECFGGNCGSGGEVRQLHGTDTHVELAFEVNGTKDVSIQPDARGDVLSSKDRETGTPKAS
jgi:hypothetical protein